MELLKKILIVKIIYIVFYLLLSSQTGFGKDEDCLQRLREEALQEVGEVGPPLWAI